MNPEKGEIKGKSDIQQKLTLQIADSTRLPGCARNLKFKTRQVNQNGNTDTWFSDMQQKFTPR